ncbi:MAG: ABC-2 type transport system permease protein [Planctomycetota bacterium]|jgi:ABC-2 type transport system permease protein
MSKIFTIGATEYLNAVRSKAFLIGIIFMPIMMSGGIIVQAIVDDTVDTTERNFAVLDKTGKLFEVLESAVQKRNDKAFELVVAAVDGEQPERNQVRPLFPIERYKHAEEETRSAELVLSERVRNGDLFAFVVIEKNAFASKSKPKDLIGYYSGSPSYGDLSQWVRSEIQTEVERVRLEKEELDADVVEAITHPVHFNEYGLIKENEEGGESDKKEDNKFETFVIPFASMFLMFAMIMMSAPQSLNVVLEEKMQKISEVLISAVTPFELMMGKLLGTVYLSMTLSFLYLGGIMAATHYFEVENMVPLLNYGWFLLFQLMALAIFSSIFAAIGAACSEMRDAQSLMTPAMLIFVLPMFFLGPVLESPHGTLATVLSLFPPATPMIMMVRVSIAPGPPEWQLALSVVLTALFTIGCVWAAGKVFRIGLLSTGQAPSIRKLIGWVFSK